MTDPAIRLAPSGKPLSNANGGAFAPGSGSRIRLVEANSPMAGTVAIPTDDTGIISPAGFGVSGAAVVLTLGSPSSGLKYRATLALDVSNTSTNTEGSVELFIDASIDDGATFVNIYNNTHAIAAVHPSLTGIAEVRGAQLWAPLTSGQALNIVSGTTPSLKIRARVKSLGGITAVSSTGGTGTIHMELEECY